MPKIRIHKTFKDKRGSLKINFENNGISLKESISKKNVFRGLHFQKVPHAQAKLVRVLSGSILDIVVDLRKDSASYLAHKMFRLSKRNFKQIYIPEGFAHGFLTLSPNTEVFYKLSDFYYPDLAQSLSWEDEALNIKLPIKTSDLIIDDKDRNAMKIDQLVEN